MKRSAIISVMLLALLLLPQLLCAQTSGVKEFGGKMLPYVVEGKDTIYLSTLKPAHVYQRLPRKKGKEWRKYYKLVYNFAKVYPYVLVAKDVVDGADSVIRTNDLKYVKKERYVNRLIAELFDSFEKPMRNLTVTQGALLMKLVNRECGVTSYDIIKEFKNRYAAGFWQGVAKLFGSDLKKPYDPLGADAATEELVHQWENGTFEKTYFEIFWEYPPFVELPEKYHRPNLNMPHARKEVPQESTKQSTKKSSSKS